jgi:hypothetical protein
LPSYRSPMDIFEGMLMGGIIIRVIAFPAISISMLLLRMEKTSSSLVEMSYFWWNPTVHLHHSLYVLSLSSLFIKSHLSHISISNLPCTNILLPLADRDDPLNGPSTGHPPLLLQSPRRTGVRKGRGASASLHFPPPFVLLIPPFFIRSLTTRHSSTFKQHSMKTSRTPCRTHPARYLPASGLQAQRSWRRGGVGDSCMKLLFIRIRMPWYVPLFPSFPNYATLTPSTVHRPNNLHLSLLLPPHQALHYAPPHALPRYPRSPSLRVGGARTGGVEGCEEGGGVAGGGCGGGALL